MAQYFSFTFNGKNYEARCTSRSTRNGFAHDCEVRDENYNDICKATCHYLNRTWECFRFESVLHSAIGAMEAQEIADEICDYKDEHNCSRLPKGMKGELETKWRKVYAEAVKTIKALN